MKNETKTDLLLRMMEQPELYSEEQWHDILCDDECRELYALMALTRGTIDAERTKVSDEDVDEAWKRAEMKNRKYKLLFIRKIAAVFIVFAFLGGIAFAAYHVLSHRQTPPTDVSTFNPQPSTLNTEADSLVRFTDIRLDSILAVVGSHYGREVCFRDTLVCALRLHTTWNRTQPLDSLVVTLNEFEVLKLTDEQDTLFVESIAEEVER